MRDRLDGTTIVEANHLGNGEESISVRAWVGQRCFEVYVGKVARHWRICQRPVGPAMEGHEWYPDKETAIEVAKQVVEAGQAAFRLAGVVSDSYAPFPGWRE